MLDVRHATVRNSASSPGMAHGTRSPGVDAVPRGGVPDAEQVTVCCCCACPRTVASAGRRSVCDRCDLPVVQSINENGRDGCSRPGQAQEGQAPMPNAEYPDALAALRAAVRRGERHIEVQCPNGECGLELLLVDDTAPRRDGFGFPQYEEAIYVIEPGEEHDPEAAQLTFCPDCDRYLAPDVVVLRTVDALRSVA